MYFNLGAVLTITTGRLLCSLDELYGILNHMTGDSLFTHQLPRASEACEKPLLAQFPKLAEVQVPDGLSGKDAVESWLEQQKSVYGNTFDVEPLKAWHHVDPLDELVDITDKPVIAVVVD